MVKRIFIRCGWLVAVLATIAAMPQPTLAKASGQCLSAKTKGGCRKKLDCHWNDHAKNCGKSWGALAKAKAKAKPAVPAPLAKDNGKAREATPEDAEAAKDEEF